jgi:hypothetical protein
VPRLDVPGLFALFAIVTLVLTVAEKLFALPVPKPLLFVAAGLCMAAMLAINFVLGTGEPKPRPDPAED